MLLKGSFAGYLGVQIEHGAIHHLGSILEVCGRGWVAH